MKAMVLAAGFGTRMRPLTNDRPKPLIPVQGRAMLDHVLDKIAAAGISDVVVNSHYLGAMIGDHLNARNDLNITLSPEKDVLETGGGVKHALPILGEGPWLVCNADMYWVDGPVPLIPALMAAWNPNQMDVLLTLFPKAEGFGYGGKGDFFQNSDGTLQRRGDAPAATYVYTGVQILQGPELFAKMPEDGFSLNLVYDQALNAQKLYGFEHQGGRWFHIGTPDALRQAEAELSTADE